MRRTNIRSTFRIRILTTGLLLTAQLPAVSAAAKKLNPLPDIQADHRRRSRRGRNRPDTPTPEPTEHARSYRGSHAGHRS